MQQFVNYNMYEQILLKAKAVRFYYSTSLHSNAGQIFFDFSIPLQEEALALVAYQNTVILPKNLGLNILQFNDNVYLEFMESNHKISFLLLIKNYCKHDLEAFKNNFTSETKCDIKCFLSIDGKGIGEGTKNSFLEITVFNASLFNQIPLLKTHQVDKLFIKPKFI